MKMMVKKTAKNIQVELWRSPSCEDVLNVAGNGRPPSLPDTPSDSVSSDYHGFD